VERWFGGTSDIAERGEKEAPDSLQTEKGKKAVEKKKTKKSKAAEREGGGMALCVEKERIDPVEREPPFKKNREEREPT